MGSKNKPGAFDCYANAHPDEPMFILLGRDPTAAIIVSAWIELRAALGHPEDHAKLAEASECVQLLTAWAMQLGKDEKVKTSMRVWRELHAMAMEERQLHGRTVREIGKRLGIDEKLFTQPQAFLAAVKHVKASRDMAISELKVSDDCRGAERRELAELRAERDDLRRQLAEVNQLRSEEW